MVNDAVDKYGYVKVLATPLTGLATVGGVLALLGNNWWIFAIVVSGAISALALLLLYVDWVRSSNSRKQIDDLKANIHDLESKVQENEAKLKVISVELDKLHATTESVRFITETMSLCCSTAPRDTLILNGSVRAEDVCKVQDFDDLETDVLDCARELLGPDRRLAIYYGNESRLVPVHKSGWKRGSRPRVLVANQPRTQLEVRAKSLFDLLSDSPDIYVPDMANPSDIEKSVVDIVPDHTEYRTLACFRLASVHLNGSSECAKIFGLLLVQDARVGALDTRVDGSETSLERQFLAVLANILATSFLGVCKSLTEMK